MADKMKTKAGRTRNFATVVYPESAPDNWRDILVDLKVPCFISPLHQFDVNPTGEVKKAHYHIQFMFDGVKTAEQVKEIVKTFGGVGLEVVNSARGMARYLCHLDNPEKFQYNTEEVTCLCGADYIGTINLTTDRYKAIGEMMAFCRDNGITSFADLVDYARVNQYDWFRALCDNATVIMKEYLKSCSWSSNKRSAS